VADTPIPARRGTEPRPPAKRCSCMPSRVSAMRCSSHGMRRCLQMRVRGRSSTASTHWSRCLRRCRV